MQVAQKLWHHMHLNIITSAWKDRAIYVVHLHGQALLRCHCQVSMWQHPWQTEFFVVLPKQQSAGFPATGMENQTGSPTWRGHAKLSQFTCWQWLACMSYIGHVGRFINVVCWLIHVPQRLCLWHWCQVTTGCNQLSSLHPAIPSHAVFNVLWKHSKRVAGHKTVYQLCLFLERKDARSPTDIYTPKPIARIQNQHQWHFWSFQHLEARCWHSSSCIQRWEMYCCHDKSTN